MRHNYLLYNAQVFKDSRAPLPFSLPLLTPHFSEFWSGTKLMWTSDEFSVSRQQTVNCFQEWSFVLRVPDLFSDRHFQKVPTYLMDVTTWPCTVGTFLIRTPLWHSRPCPISVTCIWTLTLSLLRVISFKFPLWPHQKYYITQYGERGFS